MRNGKAPNPSGIISKMLKTLLETSREAITLVTNFIIRKGKIC